MSYFSSSVQKMIIGRLIGIESSREQTGAKVETNVIKEGKRSDEPKKKKRVGMTKNKKSGSFESEKKSKATGRFPVSSCPGKKADAINKKCQPWEMSFAGQLRKVNTRSRENGEKRGNGERE